MLAAIAAGLFGVAFFAYAGALDAELLSWDDPLHVRDNPHIRSFELANLRWMLTSTEAHNWHPLVWLSHAIDYALFGLDPRGHHLGSVVIHCLNTVWLFVLGIAVLQILRSPGPLSLRPSDLSRESVVAAAIAALLFGVHPQHVESVAWVSERKDVLCLFFLFPAILCYLAYAREPEPHRRRTLFSLSLLFHALAIMSKAMAVTLPALLLVLDLYPLQRLPLGARGWPNAEQRREWARILLEKLPYGALSVAASAVAVLAQGEGVAGLANAPKGFRVLNAINSLAFYIEKMLWPSDLSTYYTAPADYHSFWHSLSSYGLPLALVGAVSLLCLAAWWRGRPLWLAAWLFYLVTLSPVIGIIQVGGQAAADRYAYLPTIPFYLMLGAALSQRLCGRASLAAPLRWMVIALLVGVTGLLVTLTRAQTRYWQNDIVFWQRAAVYAPRYPLINYGLGMAYREAGDYEDAIRVLGTLGEVDPGKYENRWILSDVYRRAGRYGEALDVLEPIAQTLREHQDQGVYRDIAEQACGQGRYGEAQRAIEKALVLDPRDAGTRRLADEIRRRSCR
jgi:tetratricopeptide (TPR) repeat protein